MKYLKFFENFENKITINYLKHNFPIEMDDFYLSRFGKENFYIIIDDKPLYFSSESGLNLTKNKIVHQLQSQGLIQDERVDIPTIKDYLRNVIQCKRFIWIHGLPGSGKSYLSNTIQKNNPEKSYQLLDDIGDLNKVKDEIENGSNIILSSPYFENYIKWTKLFEKLNKELTNNTDYFVKHIWFENDLESCKINLEQRTEHKIPSSHILGEMNQYSKDYIIPARAITIPVYTK